MWYSFQPYVSMAERAAKARAEIDKLQKKGGNPQPLVLEGRKIAKQFWGKAWCEHIKQYCDLHNRLDKGRSYVTNNLVIDFNLSPGKVKASVMGSSVYFVEIKIDTLQPTLWSSIKTKCAGHIGSLVDLLSGKLEGEVMSVITQPTEGLFPVGKQMTFKCSCPDANGGNWMCKHIAATLYGVGARIDGKPEELFVLRGVDHLDLISAATALPTLPGADSSAATIAEDALADVFGIELDMSPGDVPLQPTTTPASLAPSAESKRPKVSKTPGKIAPEGTTTSVARPAKKRAKVVKRAINPKTNQPVFVDEPPQKTKAKPKKSLALRQAEALAGVRMAQALTRLDVAKAREAKEEAEKAAGKPKRMIRIDSNGNREVR